LQSLPQDAAGASASHRSELKNQNITVQKKKPPCGGFSIQLER